MVAPLCNGEWECAPKGDDGPVAQPHSAHLGSLLARGAGKRGSCIGSWSDARNMHYSPSHLR